MPGGGRVSLYDELKRRNVGRVAVVYGATAFVMLQAADLLAAGLGLPDWVLWPAGGGALREGLCS